MATDNSYGSRKFLLAAFVTLTSAAAMFTHLMSGAEFAACASGIFTVFCGGDVALNAVYARANGSVASTSASVQK